MDTKFERPQKLDMTNVIPEIKKIIDQLNLTKHPEGGYYRETYRSLDQVEVVLDHNLVSRSYATSIYFLLTQNEFSAFHRIKQDEIWHFYSGSPVLIHMICDKKGYRSVKLGTIESGFEPQFVVPANTWFASEVYENGAYALVGCGVAPGFSFNDFELVSQKRLLKLFPKFSSIILRLTREASKLSEQ